MTTSVSGWRVKTDCPQLRGILARSADVEKVGEGAFRMNEDPAKADIRSRSVRSAVYRELRDSKVEYEVDKVDGGYVLYLYKA